MITTVFVELKFWLLVAFSLILPVAIYGGLLAKRAVSPMTVLILGVMLVAIGGFDVYLLQSLVAAAKATPSLADDGLFLSELTLGLYLLPALFAGIGVNLISHVLIRHLSAAERQFEKGRRSTDRRADRKASPGSVAAGFTRSSYSSPVLPKFGRLDQRLERLGDATIVALAVCGVLIVGIIDYLTGNEVSLSLFYLGPVALAAWYGGPRTGIGIAIFSCISWYVAEVAVGSHYSHPTILVWNALVRLGFFLVTSFLLTALRSTLLAQRHLARTDGLTELYNRRAFEDRLRHDLALAQRHHSPVTVAYLDLDDFKSVNDTRGHAGGDRVLRATGQVLRDSVRQSDTAARLGGDEFALVLPDTDHRAAQLVISKVGDGLRQALGPSAWGVTYSIGVTTFLDAKISLEGAIAAADEVMYEVKGKGKGAIAFRVIDGSGRCRTSAAGML